MIDNEIGQEYLDQFDTLDIAEKPQRRVGVYVLKEFYATVMVEVGREYLSIEESINRKPIKELWGLSLARIESLYGYSNTDFASNDLFSGLSEYRRQSHHNTDYNPPIRQLEELRDLAPDWRDWLLKYGKKYYKYEKELDPHGTIVEMAMTTLQEIKAKRPTGFESSLSQDLIVEADSLMKQLERHKENNDEITTELIDILKTSLVIREEMEQELISWGMI